MKVIIAGGRENMVTRDTCDAINASGWKHCINEVVSGGARGVDRDGEAWADYRCIQITVFPVTKADWQEYGKAAGPMRNRRMAAYADALIAVWDGKSRGTRNMIAEARKAGLQVFVWIPERHDAAGGDDERTD